MDPQSRAQKKNTSHGHDVLPQDTTHLIKRPCYQRGSPCQDPAGNWTTRRPPDHRKETQSASCFPFTRSGQNHLARHSARGKKTRQTEEEVGRQHQGMDRPGVRHLSVVPQRPSRLRQSATGPRSNLGVKLTHFGFWHFFTLHSIYYHEMYLFL